MGLLLLVHSLFLQLLSLLLHGSKTGGKATGLLCRIVLVLLVLGLEDGKQLLVVGSLAEGPHDSGGEEQGDEVVEVQTTGLVVEHKEENDGHEVHHPLHHLHLLSLVSYHLILLLAHSHIAVEYVCYAEKNTGQ